MIDNMGLCPCLFSRNLITACNQNMNICIHSNTGLLVKFVHDYPLIFIGVKLIQVVSKRDSTLYCISQLYQ